jgi:hypothetical protein
VLILDVCRFDPARGQERMAPGSMTPGIAAALRNPPPGVQVWSSCAAGQQSIDLFQGSLFQEALGVVLKTKAGKGIQEPTDPIPVGLLQNKVAGYMAQILESEKFKQTPRLAGKDPNRGAAYDPDKDMPLPLVILPPPGLKDGAAGRAQVQSILNEIERLPPAKGLQGNGGERLHFEVMPPFSATRLKKYQADYRSLAELDQRLKDNPGQFKLIRAVRHAMRVLEKNVQGFNQFQRGPRVSPAEKERVKTYQTKVVARVIDDLEEALKQLKKAGDDRDSEASQRWQANYDYVLVKLASRLIHVREYSLLLGKVRGDELPQLGAGHTGWRLVSVPKLRSASDKFVKESMGDIKDALANLMKKHAGTPWEVLARRDKGTYLGLQWEPTNK